ncbi:MAG TPA: membrane protein insertion efficiency factor YidD [Candidatus Binataceae bacterium]|nr:membrane protein insertion efficiency factor YidD [Candidatus Binataceae bacterium]
MTEFLHDVSERLRAAALAAALGAVAAYRWSISPLLAAMTGPACRFEPTCSEYAQQALAIHGLGRGLYLTLRRLLRCRPRGGWGYDPVPTHPTHGPQHP